MICWHQTDKYNRASDQHPILPSVSRPAILLPNTSGVMNGTFIASRTGRMAGMLIRLCIRGTGMRELELRLPVCASISFTPLVCGLYFPSLAFVDWEDRVVVWLFFASLVRGEKRWNRRAFAFLGTRGLYIDFHSTFQIDFTFSTSVLAKIQ